MQEIARAPKRPFLHNFLRLALPIMAQNLLMAGMHVVDSVFIGQLPISEYPLAGVAQANRITFLFQIAAFGLASGASVFFAQYWGKRDQRGIDRALGLGTILGLALAALFALPSMLAPQAILKLLLASDTALRYGAVYLRVVALSFFPYAVSMVLGASLKSTERVMLPMFASLAGAAVDTLMSYVLIFGRLGAPRLEVAGAAAGSVLGVLVELLILGAVSLHKRYIVPATLVGMWRVPLSFVKKFLRVALPVMGNELLWGMGIVAHSAAYGNMPGAAIATAAVNIYSNVEMIASVVLRGTTQATAVLIGISIGAGREKDARRDAKRMFLVNVGTAILISALVLLLGGAVTNWYNVADFTRVSAQRLIRTYAFVMPLMAANSALLIGIFRPGGDTTYAMLLDVLPMWLIGVPFAFIAALVLQWPIQHVFLATRAEDVLKIVFGLYRLYSGKWVHNLVKNDGRPKSPAG